jgi:hypothetical protein
MKSLAIGLGGDHLLADDLEWMQSAITETLVALSKTTGATFIALYGVDMTVAAGNRTWTAGWVLINGELCQVDAGSFPDHPNNTFNIVETFDVTGQDTYEDLNIVQTYKVRKAAITSNLGGATQWDQLKRFSDFYANSTQAWLDPALLLGGDWTYGIAKFKKNKAFQVQLVGDFVNASIATPGDATMMTLPIGYRPGNKITIICAAIVNSARVMLHVDIESGGAIKPQGLAAADSVQIFFNHTFPTEF